MDSRGGSTAESATGEPEAEVQRLFAGRFRTQRLIQRALGIDTYIGRDLQAQGREVVIRTVAVHAVSSSTRARIEYEVAVLNQSVGPGVGGPLQIGVDAGFLYLIRPYISGFTLAERLERGPLSIQDTVALGIDVLSALDDAHRAGVLHRALKPSNIILADADARAGDASALRSRIVDFCLPRTAQTAGSLAEVSASAATHQSPEQSGLLDSRVDGRSDLFSCGVILYECLAGRPPFQGETVRDILRVQLTLRPPPLESVVPGLPHALARIVERLLRKDPRDRYQTAAGARADLEELAAAVAAGGAGPEIVVGSRDPRGTLTEPAFIGRAEQLAALEEALSEARAGRGGLVLVEAESGAGKTWLLQELGRRSVHGDAWVLHGYGLDQVAPRPYQVVAGLAHEIILAAQGDPARHRELVERTGPLGASVCTSLPELSTVFGVTAGPSQGPEEHGQARSMAALSALLDALGSASRPALVLIDDGQWADEPTLRLLERWQAAQGEDRRHVLMVVAFRTEEVPPGHELRDVPVSRHIRLSAFEPEEVRQQLASMAGKLPEEAIDTVIRHAGGNPFLVVATLHGLVEAGALKPGSGGWLLDPPTLADLQTSARVGDVLARRMDRLSPEARELLTVGAVLGRSFDPVLAGSLAGLAFSDALRLIDGCRGKLVWEEQGGTTFAFLHDKIRETLLARLSDPARRRLHLLAAEHLQATDPDRVFELAYHFDAAGIPGRALPSAVTAAERARARFALELAERQYRIAARGVAADDREMRHRIARGLGEVLALRSRHEEAVVHLEAALALATLPRVRAEVEERLGMLEVSRGNLRASYSHCEAALRHVDRWVPRNVVTCFFGCLWELGVQVLHTHFPRFFVGRRPREEVEPERFTFGLYSSLQATYFFSKGPTWAAWAHLRALNLVERYPPTVELARVLGDHAPVTAGFPSLWDRGIRFAGRGASLAAELGDPWTEAASLTFQSLVLGSAARFGEAIETARRARVLFERTGDRWRADTDLYFEGVWLYRQGNMRAAREVAENLWRRGVELDDVHARAWALDVWARATDGKVPRELVERLREGAHEQVQTYLVARLAEGVLLLGEGRAAEAVALFDETLEYHRRKVGVFHDLIAPLVMYQLTALRQQAEETPFWDGRRRRRVVARGRRVSARAVAMGRKYRNNLAQALRDSAALAALDGKPDLARAQIDESVATAEALGQTHEKAMSQSVRARLGLALGWPGAAEEQKTAEEALRALRGVSHDSIVAADPAASPQAPPVTLSLIDRYTTVLEAGRRIATALDPDQVFGELRRAALALLRAERCVILEMADPGNPEAELRPVHGDAGPFSPALVRDALARDRPVVESSGAAAPPIHDSLRRAAIRSAMCVPLRIRGRASACLYVTHGDVSDLFGEEEQRIARFLATLAGAALENAEGFAQIQALSRVLETRVQERTAELAQANEDLERNLQRLRETQDQLVQAGKMAAVGTLVAGLSHELNNPIGIILGYVQALIREAPEGLSAAALTAIERQTLRCRRLVQTLLDFSRTSPPRRCQVDPAKLFRCVTELAGGQARDRRITLNSEMAPGVPEVLVAEEEMESALLNLVSNALDATPAGGTVTLEAKPASRDGEPGVVLTVKDTGEGIAPEVLPRMFDPFFTTKPAGRGTGLGLSLTREIVDANGGKIDVSTEPGAGTRIDVWLPARTGEAPPNAKAPGPETGAVSE